MANKKLLAQTGLGEQVSLLLVDNGDGTYSMGSSQSSVADGSDATIGAKADARAAWYDSVASVVALLKLAVAALVDAGSHAYGYNGSNQLTTDAWTLFGTTRTKTFTWVGSNMTAETDWV